MFSHHSLTAMVHTMGKFITKVSFLNQHPSTTILIKKSKKKWGFFDLQP